MLRLDSRAMGTADSVRLKGCPKQLFVKAVLVWAGSADSVCFPMTAELARTERRRASLMVCVAAKVKVQPLVVHK